jgi:hypothetical protein
VQKHILSSTSGRTLLALAAAIIGLLALSASAAEIGITREELIAEKGSPTSFATAGSKTILKFADGEVFTLIDGKVVSVVVESVSQPTASSKSSRTNHHPSPPTSVDGLTEAVLSLPFNKQALGLALGAAALAAIISFKIFFDDMYDFKECLRFQFQPDWLSLWRGEWWDDKWASIKMLLWNCVWIGAGLWTYYALVG